LAIRVHLLAKELAVKSKAILEKCRAEGLDVKNHMSVLSAGLEATIREWFTEGEHQTTQEVTDRVDLKKVRIKPRKRTRKKAKPAGKEDTKVKAGPGEAEPAAAEPTAEVAVVEPSTEGQIPEGTITIEQPPAEAVAGEQAPPVEEEKEPVTEEEKAKEVQPKRPARTKLAEPKRKEPTKPAGYTHTPAPAVLQGPRVVRVEHPEPTVRRPRPTKPTRAPAPTKPPTPPAPATVPETPAAKVVRPTRKKKLPTTDEDTVSLKAKKAKARGQLQRRRIGDGTEQLKEWRDRDLLERSQRLAAASDHPQVVHRAEPRKGKHLVHLRQAQISGKVQIAEPIVMKDFCAATGVSFNRLFPKLMEFGMPATINQPITAEQAEMLGLAFEIEIEVTRRKSRYDQIVEEFAGRDHQNTQPRAPVVTLLGHVDHGKTSLLDYVRQSRIVQGEPGGITQHVGAYRYEVDGRYVVFLDTPGHEAFTAMRARGAQMTDIVVLVVAADDGVMPQTVEAINHARAADVPIVVALNKIDLPNTDTNRILGQLAEHQLVPAEWGGETDIIKTSATTGEGIDELIEHLNTLAEVLELKADATSPTGGVIIEARQDTHRGPVADLMVQEGTVKVGDVLFAGSAYGRVRAVFDDLGTPIAQAGPSTPVEVLGFDEVPQAGERFYGVEDLQTAKEIAEEKRQEDRRSEWTSRPKVTLETVFQHVSEGEVKQLNTIVRADTQGSVDALKMKLEELSTDEVKVRILHAGTGGITEGDVLLAGASEAIIIGFGTVADDLARSKAQELGVQIRVYTVIYHLLDDITQALEGMLEPTYEQNIRGRATVKEIFRISRVGMVAGCRVTEGVIERSSKIRIIRESVIIREGSALESLRRFKDDVRDVRQGFECGLKIAGFDDLKNDDVIEAYEMIEVARKLQPVGDQGHADG